MEEKKLKPFNLEKAKQGAKVITRDGRPARIICWDRVGKLYPIVALVECHYNDGKTEEEVMIYTNQGTYNDDGTEHCYDLFMAPTVVERWMNVYKCGGGYAYSYYSSEQEALKHKDNYSEYVTTTKISWEE